MTRGGGGESGTLRTALHTAASEGLVSTVRLLLQRGADRSLRSSEGKTALDYAECKKYAEIVEILQPVMAEEQARAAAEAKENARHTSVVQKQDILRAHAPKIKLKPAPAAGGAS